MGSVSLLRCCIIKFVISISRFEHLIVSWSVCVFKVLGNHESMVVVLFIFISVIELLIIIVIIFILGLI